MSPLSPVTLQCLSRRCSHSSVLRFIRNERLSGWFSLNMAACSALSHSANLSVCISNLCLRVCLINAGTDHSLNKHNMKSSCDCWLCLILSQSTYSRAEPPLFKLNHNRKERRTSRRVFAEANVPV